MALSLLLLGGYAAAKGGKHASNKEKWDRIVAEYDLEKHFEDVLILCGSEHTNWTNKVPEITEDSVRRCVKNLQSIPYLTNKDIKDFKIKAWETRLEQIMQEKEQKQQETEEKLQKIERQIKYSQKQRRTCNIRNTKYITPARNRTLYKMYTTTPWGEIVYNPKYDQWLKNNNMEEEPQIPLTSSNVSNNKKWADMPSPCGYTEKYEVWVVDAPIGYNVEEIYHACQDYVLAHNETEEENKIKNKISDIKFIVKPR